MNKLLLAVLLAALPTVASADTLPPDVAVLAARFKAVNEQTTLIDGCDFSRADELKELDDQLRALREEMWRKGYVTNEVGAWTRQP